MTREQLEEALAEVRAMQAAQADQPSQCRMPNAPTVAKSIERMVTTFVGGHLTLVRGLGAFDATVDAKVGRAQRISTRNISIQKEVSCYAPTISGPLKPSTRSSKVRIIHDAAFHCPLGCCSRACIRRTRWLRHREFAGDPSRQGLVRFYAICMRTRESLSRKV